MKRFFLWSAGILVVIILAAALAFKLSPWPSVAIITYAFAKGDQASNAALEKHVPAHVVWRRDIAYGPEKDEVFDLYYGEGTSAPRPAIVWIHGGGFVAGSKNGIANYMKILANHGYTVIAPEYSRGYGTAYPHPVEQLNAALGCVSRNASNLGVDPATIILAGDSAGAHLASQLAMITTDPQFSKAIGIAPQLPPNQLAAMLLVSELFDPSSMNFEGNYGLFLKSVLWAYSGIKDFQKDERFPLMSVTANVTKTFPPSFISSGNGDPLESQGKALTETLQKLGVSVQSLFFDMNRTPPLAHGYQFNLDDLAGQEALERMLAFLELVRQKRAAHPQN